MNRLALAAALLLALAGAARAQGADAGPPAPGPDAGPPAPGPDAGPAPGADAGPGGGGPLEAGQLSKAPVLKKQVQAEYPPEALEKGIEADVVLLIDIGEDGSVQSVGIAQPADPPGLGFDEAALIAAQQFEFEPAELDGKPIAVQITYRTKFRLPKKAPETTEETQGAGGGGEGEGKGASRPEEEPVVNFAGTLLERGTRLPLGGVTVTVFRDDGDKQVGFEAVTDDSGAFSFYDLAPGTWKVLAEPPGYYPLRTSDDVIEGKRTDATYYLERGSYNPYDVTITATRPKKEVSRTVISAAEIDKVPGTAGDPLTVVQNFAGVARTFGGQLVVRGSAPEDSRYFVDGAEVPLIYHFGGLKSVIPIGVLDSIEFYPGNFSPAYGRATGGIVDVRIKDLSPKKIGGYADVSLLDTGVFLKMPLGDKGGLAVAGRRSYVDGIISAAVPSSAPVHLVTAPRYYDFQVMGNYRPAPAHDLRAFAIASDDRLRLLFTNPADLDPSLESNALSSSSSFYRSLWTYRYVPSDRFKNELRVAQGRNWLNFRAGKLIFDLEFYSAQLRDTVSQRLGDRLTLSYGADVLYSLSNAHISLPRPPSEGEPPGNFDINDTITTEVHDRGLWSPAAFVEAAWRPIPGLLVLPGLRVDGFERTGEVIPQPRLTARWKLSSLITAKGGAGLFAEEPNYNETNEDFGNPDLEAERALHYSGGVEIKPTKALTFDVTGFYKSLYHLVSPTDRLVMRGGETRPLLYDNRGEGHVIGMELVVRHELSEHLSGWIAYTLSRAERHDSGAQRWRLFDFDQTHILTIVGSYLLPRNWQIGGRFRLVSGNPMTPVVGSVYNASADRYDPVYGPVNSDRNPPFHQLDVRVDKSWIYKSWILDAYLDIQNIYNRANPEGLSYNYDFSESQTQQGLPILTIVGLRAEF